MDRFCGLKKCALGLLLLLVSGNLLAATVSIESGDRRVNLVELYTSEGCSSCPPADAWLNRFVDDKGLWKQVIPVAFHVDYWDYIGWKDRYAQPQFSERQYRYQREGGIGTVYTPGVLVNGKEWRRWRWFGMRPGREDQPVGVLKLEVADNGVTAQFDPLKKPVGELRLYLAVLAFGLESDVAAGENRGRELQHDFVVVGLNASDSSDLHWHSPLPKIKVTDSKRLALVAWVSEQGRQAPLQAAGGWLPKTK